jgi:hypothetical protein
MQALKPPYNLRFLAPLPLQAPQFLLKHFTPAQFRQRPALGFLFGRAAGQQLRVVVVEILRQFLDDGGFARMLKIQARQPLVDLLLPIRHTSSTHSAMRP